MVRLIILLALIGSLVSAACANAARMPVEGLTVHYFDCPAYEAGSTCSQPETAEVWLAAGTGRFEFWHEVGHVFDYQALDDRARAWLTAALGFPPETPWLGDKEFYRRKSLAESVPGEVFADAFAACQMNLRVMRRSKMVVSDWATAYGYLPTVRQHRRVCNAIAVLDLVAR